MAQPLFDQHPLEEYFRNTGEIAEPMPGGSPDFVFEDVSIDGDHSSTVSDIRLPPFVLDAIQIAHDLLQTSSCTAHENTFAERFKYDVISSSLLSSSLAAPASSMRRTFNLDLPGKLDDGASDISDRPSTPDQQKPQSSLVPLGEHLPLVLLSIAVVVLSTGYLLFAMIPLVAAVYARYVVVTDVDRNSTNQTMDALNELILSGNAWDSAVNEAIMLIENEERSIFYGPTSPQAPSSALRIALQSSLHTTQIQSDNVRHLLSALTSPTTLSQLAEMYAPPSPIRPTFSLADGPRSPSSPTPTMRPFSHPMTTWRHRKTYLPHGSVDKRSTWNGSYAALALAGSPMGPLSSRKKQNRRSDVVSLFQPMPVGPGRLSSFSAPVSPQPLSPAPNGGLEDVTEEDDHIGEELESKNYFGAAALDLQRKRQSAGLDAFSSPPPVYSPPRSPLRPSGNKQPLSLHTSTMTSSSKLTAVHTTRHPLSLSGLHLALHGALAAKRYSCSHLLALRFNEEEDDSYWENVRSIMALLTSSFSDASARLVEALDTAEKRRRKDEHPTPPRGNTPTPNGKTDSREHSMSPLRNQTNPMTTMAEMFSFAPMPSSMARLGGHIDAISTAMTDARGHIEECVAALRRHQHEHSSRTPLPSMNNPVMSIQDHAAFQAYDRLRKELGFALRECERGRERLLDIISPRTSPNSNPAEDDEADPNTPGLKHDSESEASEKGPVSPHVQSAGLGIGPMVSFGGREDGLPLGDDTSAQLLLGADVRHLPPVGVEQVFEGESGSGAGFVRERSKVSREERIRAMKVRRASGVPQASLGGAVGSGEDDGERRGRERWGPGGEVVQELKDVIWKVGEKRRKMSQLQQDLPLPPPSPACALVRPAEEDEALDMKGASVEEAVVVETLNKVDVGAPAHVLMDAAPSPSSSSPPPSAPSSPPLTPPRLPLPPLSVRDLDDTLRTRLSSVHWEGVADMS